MFRITHLLVTAFLCFFSFTLVAKKPKLSLPYEKYQLKNGLEVILQHDSRTPFVAVSVWYHVGAINEGPSRTGFAHLFEHLMFQGTPNVGNDMHFAHLEKAGATSINGTTSFDRTNYFEVVPSNELELALWLESDRMGWLMDGISQKNLDGQRGVVKNERRQRYENQPYGIAMEKAWQAIFDPKHPYHGQVIGSMEHLNRASLKDVQEFFYKFYAPKNATITIVGDYNPKSIKPIVRKYFGSLRGGKKPKKPQVAIPKIPREIVIHEVEPLGKLPLIQIHYVTPALFRTGDADFDVIGFILAGNQSSRLSKALMYDQQLTQFVSAHQSSFGDVSLFSVRATLNPGVEPDKVLKIIDATLQDLEKHPPSKSEILQAINTLETQKLLGLQKIGGNYGRTEQLQTYNHHVGNPDWLSQDLNRYLQINSKSISQAAKQYLKKDHRVILIATPEVHQPTKEKNS